jgi:hypothetical protein
MYRRASSRFGSYRPQKVLQQYTLFRGWWLSNVISITQSISICKGKSLSICIPLRARATLGYREKKKVPR